MAERKFDEQFLDQSTGQTVNRIKIPDSKLEDLVKAIQAHTANNNAFVQSSFELASWRKRQMQAFEAQEKTKNEIDKTVLRVRDEMELDSSWVYNIEKQMMEKREAPPSTKVMGD